MAPALTETNQEDNFKLPHSPNSTTIINATQNSNPYDIIPNKCHLTNFFIGKSDAELNGLATEDNFDLNDALLNGCNINPMCNGDNGDVGLRNKRNVSMCELSKLVTQKLTNASKSASHKKSDGKKCQLDSLLPKFNGEFDCSNAKYNCDEETSKAFDEKMQWDDASKRLEAIRGNALRLMRWIRCLQMQQTTTHVGKEIGSFVPYGRTKIEGYQDGHRKSKFLQKFAHSSNRYIHGNSTITLSHVNRRLHNLREKHGIAFPVATYVEAKTNSEVSTLKISSSDCTEINRTVGTLLCNLKHLESTWDSDATESSSGGESCDEYDDLQDRRKVHEVPIHRRASWKWAVSRAEIACRWIWLQSQITELEQRIRQLGSLCQKFRSAKESYTSQQFGMSVDNSANNRTQKQMSNIKNNSSYCDHWDNSSNGYVMQKLTNTNCNISENSFSGASRTRPLKTLRKRKLYWLTDIHLTGTKAARLSVINCACKSQENILSCVLCSGHYSRMLALDPYTMPVPEKISNLESSYHPVLSLKQDIPLILHFEMLMKKCRIGKQLGKSASIQNKRHQSVSFPIPHQQRKRHKQAKKVAEMIFSSSGLNKKQKSQSLTSSPNNSRPCSPNLYYPLTPEAVPSSINGRRRRESAFDINNIVIPCCIVPAIRVEKLQYKEILTPKWRILEECKGENSEAVNDETVEDLSDEAFLNRHQKCEIKEKKWFMSYLRVRTSGRGRARSLRFDVIPNSLEHDLFSGCEDTICTPHSPGAVSILSSSEMSLEEETKDSVLDDDISDVFDQTSNTLTEIIENVKPFDCRAFPLKDEEYEEMLKETDKQPHSTVQTNLSIATTSFNVNSEIS